MKSRSTAVRWLSLAAPLVLAASVAGAAVVVCFPTNETSGPLKSVVGDKPVAAAAPLPDAKDYDRPGPTAGTHGDITLSDADAAGLKAVHFDGKTKLNLGPAEGSPLNLTGDFTVTTWAKFDNTDGYHMFLATGAGSGDGWKLGINDASITFTANGVADVSDDSYSVDTNKWVFLAMTVSGTKDERKINLFVNGKKINADTLTCDDIKPSTAAQMHLGGADNSSDVDENFVGDLSNLKVFNTVLDAAGIKDAAKPAKP